MEDLWNAVLASLSRFDLVDAVDIVIVAVLIYYILSWPVKRGLSRCCAALVLYLSSHGCPLCCACKPFHGYSITSSTAVPS